MKHFSSFLEDRFFLFNDASTQMSLLDTDVCPQLCKLTYDHLGKFEGVKIGSMIILFIFFCKYTRKSLLEVD
jgi:hypothetical protein